MNSQHTIQQPKFLRFIYKTPVALIGLIGYVYGASLILNYQKDTTLVTNAGFAIIATLSALSFSFARVIETEQLKDRVMYGGERFLHGAIFIIVGSILKYLVLSALLVLDETKYAILLIGLKITVGVLSGIVFCTGIMFAHTGLKVINDLLILRFTRYKDWDDIF